MLYDIQMVKDIGRKKAKALTPATVMRPVTRAASKQLHTEKRSGSANDMFKRLNTKSKSFRQSYQQHNADGVLMGYGC